MKFVLNILGILWDLLPNRFYFHARKSFWARQSVIFPAKHTSRCVAFLTSDCVSDSISQIASLSTEMRAAQDQVYSGAFYELNCNFSKNNIRQKGLQNWLLRFSSESPRIFFSKTNKVFRALLSTLKTASKCVIIHNISRISRLFHSNPFVVCFHLT